MERERVRPEEPRGNRAERILYPQNPRYRRIRSLSLLMDQSIILPNGFRIGLDPVLGLLPGVGDVLSCLVSSYVVYEAARLGLKKRVLARMVGNIVLDALAGAFPVIGDVFDAVWKANMRNLRLVDLHYSPAEPERPARRIVGWLLGVVLGLTAIIGLIFYTIAQAIRAMFGG